MLTASKENKKEWHISTIQTDMAAQWKNTTTRVMRDTGIYVLRIKGDTLNE